MTETSENAAALDCPQSAADNRQPDFLLLLGFLGDATMACSGLLGGFWLRFHSGWIPLHSNSAPLLGEYVNLITVGTIMLVATLAYLSLYQTQNLIRFRRSALIITKGTLFWLFAYLGISVALKFSPPISRTYVACSFLGATAALLFWRAALARVLSRIERLAKTLRQRVLFVGWNAQTEDIANEISRDAAHPYEIIGFVETDPRKDAAAPPPTCKRLGSYHAIEAILQSSVVDILVLSDMNRPRDEIIRLANICDREYVQFKVVPSYFQILVSGLQLETISNVPILGVERLPLDRIVNRMIKRIVDVVGAVVGLCLSAPLIALFGLLVYLESPGPIFYRQVRTGRDGKPFRIVKIRSMRLNAESEKGAQWAVKDDPRRLTVGAFMREWNIDEVPQFWNVLTGEMSLVGPRPERPELIEKFKYEIPHYNARHAAKPGITGWAQINGLRGDTSLTERVRYDLYYLENWSVVFDFNIMLLTFFKKENAY